METIRNYLDTMFSNFPDTEEVEKAKNELYQMMEDKYIELKDEGKNESEILGIIIAEFGNLDELAEEFGIDVKAKGRKIKPKIELRFYNVYLEDAKKYVKDTIWQAFRKAIAIAVFILSMVPLLIGESTNEGLEDRTTQNYIGLALQVIIILAGIGLFIWDWKKTSMWHHIGKGVCRLNDGVYMWLYEHRENTKFVRIVSSLAGVVLCIMSILPSAMLSGTGLFNSLAQEKLRNVVALCMVAIGVFLIMFSWYMEIAYKSIMAWEHADENTYMSGKVHYCDKLLEIVMSLYWENVLAIYLCVSFISYGWCFTWIIIPIAWIINVLVDKFFGKE